MKIDREGKRTISYFKKKYGTARAINFTQGYLGLKRGQYKKSVPGIRKLLKKL